ncbi:hypothetical protein BK004_02020 [bacterium CG10_46_32]|nr:MAG: hypothetical protein BK004_02020 [bacterium CG10_46_32]PIR56210.1 MAG: hypothetical protein COU73_02045 [Parcubacteria group bacterium CG10_big_fil_rev_8_21_14_0_10_46_32]
MTSPSQKPIERLIRSITQSPRNPYMFAAQRLVAPQIKRSRFGVESERDIVREQHQTLFEHDETMQEIFSGDFEEYFKIIEHPEILGRGAELPHTSELAELLSDGEELEAIDDEVVVPFEHDPLYQSATMWANNLHELGHSLYDYRGEKDSDVFRVTINALLVSAKIAYALDIDEEALEHESAHVFRTEIEISIRSYGLAAIFLQRVRESLLNLIEKKSSPTLEWKRALLSADAIARDIGKHVLELRRKLYPPRN